MSCRRGQFFLIAVAVETDEPDSRYAPICFRWAGASYQSPPEPRMFRYTEEKPPWAA